MGETVVDRYRPRGLRLPETSLSRYTGNHTQNLRRREVFARGHKTIAVAGPLLEA
jgi:hypothetical protein